MAPSGTSTGFANLSGLLFWEFEDAEKPAISITKGAIRDFGKLCVVGFVVYLLGFYQFSFLFVLVPIASLVIYKKQKGDKKEKVNQPPCCFKNFL